MKIVENFLPRATLALVLTLLAAADASAGTNQCVLNRGAFVATVEWWDPAGMAVKDNKLWGPAGSKPNRSKTLNAGQESCENFGKPYIAIISVKDGKFASDMLELGGEMIVAAGAGVACAVTAGSACVAAGVGAVGATKLVSMIPPGKGTFWVGVPNQIGNSKHREILEGTIWNPTARWKKM